MTSKRSDGTASLRSSLGSAWLSLLASSGTLLCCALPALLVALGAGAVMSSLVATVPQLVWLSENKAEVFGMAALMLALAGALQWRQRFAPCPVEPHLRDACMRTRRFSLWVYFGSLGLFVVGAWFAFVLPWWMATGTD